MPQSSLATLKFLEDKWDESYAAALDGPELLRYRSNLLGSDLRMTNFGGGNTSSKLETVDPVDGQKKLVLWVKGTGGDLGSIKRSGFATLYLDKLLALEKQYRGVDDEDAMVEMYPARHLRQQSRCGLHRHAASRLPSLPARRSPAPRLGHRSRRLRQRQAARWMSSTRSSATSSRGCPGSAPASSWP